MLVGAWVEDLSPINSANFVWRNGLSLLVLLALCWDWKDPNHGFSSERLYNSASPSSSCPVLWCWGRVPLFPSCCYSYEWCCWYPGSAPPGCGHLCKAAPCQGALQWATVVCLQGWEHQSSVTLVMASSWATQNWRNACNNPSGVALATSSEGWPHLN